MSLFRLNIAAMIAVGIFVCGCRDNPYGVIKVTGIVTCNNAPVKEASVVFVPKQDGNYSASGMTNEKGEFLLTTAAADGGSGAQPGEYFVAIRKVGYPEGMTIAPVEGGAILAGDSNRLPFEDPARMQVDQLPVKYKSADTSGLEAVVKKGTKNHFTFELTGQ